MHPGPNVQQTLSTFNDVFVIYILWRTASLRMFCAGKHERAPRVHPFMAAHGDANLFTNAPAIGALLPALRVVGAGIGAGNYALFNGNEPWLSAILTVVVLFPLTLLTSAFIYPLFARWMLECERLHHE